LKIIAFDIETSGVKPEYALQPWRVSQKKAWLTSFAAVRTEGDPPAFKITGCLDPEPKDLIPMFEEALDTGARIAAWNAVFEIAWMMAYGLEDWCFKVKWIDGMLLWKHYFIEPEYELQSRAQKKSYGLKPCVEEFVPWMAGYQNNVNFHSRDPAEMKKLHSYNIDDSIATHILVEKWWEKLTPMQQRCATIEADSLPHVAKANLRGMLVDQPVCSELSTKLQHTAREKLHALSPYGLTPEIIASPLKLAKLLYDDWNLPVLKTNKGKKTGKVSRSTDKESLHELAFIDPRAKELREYREALNCDTKFARTPLASVAYNEDCRVHPTASPFSTYTGRMTYSSKQSAVGISAAGNVVKVEVPIGFALHQMKREAEFRSILIPPIGYTLMEFDADGQEYKWMAIASGDETMLSLCQPGEDPHAFMASRIEGISYRTLQIEAKSGDKKAKRIRDLGKVSNLSLQYRTSYRKLRTVARVDYNIPMEIPQAKHIHDTYPQTYPRVPIYQRTQINQVQRLGYVETFAGRRVQVVGNWNGSQGWSMGSTAINYRIQGTGADQKYLAISVVSSYLHRNEIIFAWDLHDGLYFYVPEGRVQAAARDIKYLLDNLPYQKAWGFTPPVPLTWSCKTGKSWGLLKEWKEIV